MSKRTQGPRSSRGSAISKKDRETLRRLDRGIHWIDERLELWVVFYDGRERTRLQKQRDSMDERRRLLRLRMKGVGKK